MQYGYCAANLNAPHVKWMRNKLEWKYMSTDRSGGGFNAHNITIWLKLPLAVNLLLFFFVIVVVVLLCFGLLRACQCANVVSFVNTWSIVLISNNTFHYDCFNVCLFLLLLLLLLFLFFSARRIWICIESFHWSRWLGAWEECSNGWFHNHSISIFRCCGAFRCDLCMFSKTMYPFDPDRKEKRDKDTVRSHSNTVNKHPSTDKNLLFPK